MLNLVALRYKGHSSFFCGDVIAITSWAPDVVVNLVRPNLGSALPEGMYSGKFSPGANLRDFRGQTCFRENMNLEEIKIDDVISAYIEYPCERDGSLHSLSAL